MATLTGLAPDPHHPGYRLVEVDQGRFASLPGEALEPLALVVGEPLTPVVLGRLQELADVEAAYRAAVRALALRPRARADLRRRLIQKPHPPQAVDDVLTRLLARGLLDDLRFSAHYAATRAARGRGPARLLRDLLAQGVERRTAEEGVRLALAEEGIDPARTARTVAERRARQLASLPQPVRKRRLLAFLIRRGFEAPRMRELVEELCR